MKSKVIPYLKCFYLIDINSDGKIDVVNNTSALTNYHSNYYRDGYITCIYLSSPVGFNHIPLIGGITALKVGENGAEVYSSLSIGCYDPPATCSCKYFFAKNSDSISTFIRYQLNPLCGHGAKYFPDSFLFSDTLKVVKGMSFENNMWPIDGCILEIGEKAVLLSEKESYYFISFSKSGRNFLIWASKKYFEKN
ncbi:MAG: hypothetical protein IAF38_09150 [Bacteroidia bacterium]|nr:hypothetical protein [Bacteroidia bacterium]